MKKSNLITTVNGLILLSASATMSAQASEVFDGYQVSKIMSPDNTRHCAFVQLDGVNQVAPTSSAWLAVAKSHPGYKEIVLLLTTALVNETSVVVYTTGATVCGHAEISIAGAVK